MTLTNSSIKNIFTHGVLVDINIRAWTGEKRLTHQDLGIPADKLPKSFKLGSKALVPPEVLAKFKHIDNQCRLALNRYSFPFPFGSAHFVPKKAFEEFAEKFQELETLYNNEVQNLLNNYEKYRIEMRSHFVMAANAAYTRLKAIPGYDGLVKLDDKGKPTNIPLTKDDFINAFIERIEHCYPTKEALKDKYSIEFVPFQMELPDLAQATIDDVAEENTKIQLLQKGYQARIVRELQEYASKIVMENRARAQKVIDTVTENMKKGGRYTEATINMVSSMIDSFSKCNIVGDDTLEAALNNFRKQYLIPYSAKQIRESEQLNANMLRELLYLQKLVQNTDNVAAMAEAYKQKINI